MRHIKVLVFFLFSYTDNPVCLTIILFNIFSKVFLFQCFLKVMSPLQSLDFVQVWNIHVPLELNIVHLSHTFSLPEVNLNQTGTTLELFLSLGHLLVILSPMIQMLHLKNLLPRWDWSYLIVWIISYVMFIVSSKLLYDFCRCKRQSVTWYENIRWFLVIFFVLSWNVSTLQTTARQHNVKTVHVRNVNASHNTFLHFLSRSLI